jgi:hypothetical protein
MPANATQLTTQSTLQATCSQVSFNFTEETPEIVQEMFCTFENRFNESATIQMCPRESQGVKGPSEITIPANENATVSFNITRNRYQVGISWRMINICQSISHLDGVEQDVGVSTFGYHRYLYIATYYDSSLNSIGPTAFSLTNGEFHTSKFSIRNEGNMHEKFYCNIETDDDFDALIIVSPCSTYDTPLLGLNETKEFDISFYAPRKHWILTPKLVEVTLSIHPEIVMDPPSFINPNRTLIYHVEILPLFYTTDFYLDSSPLVVFSSLLTVLTIGLLQRRKNSQSGTVRAEEE